MARYLRRLSLIVCSFWMGCAFQKVYDEPTSNYTWQDYLAPVSGSELLDNRSLATLLEIYKGLIY